MEARHKNFREAIFISKSPPSVPISPAIATGSLLFVSGQTGIDDEGKLDPDVMRQTEQALANIKAILAAAHLKLSDIVKTTVYVTSHDAIRPMNAAYERFLEAPFPARSTVVVAGLPRPGAMVEVDAIAVMR